MTKTIRTIIVDDELPARRNLQHVLGKEPDIELIASCANGFEALEAIDRHALDLMFLDVQMPQMTGFEVMRRIPDDRLPVTIFVTAFDAFAIQAFEVNAIDYLLKPFDDARFQKAVARARARIRDQRERENLQLMRRLLDQIESEQPARPTPQPSEPPETHLTRLMVKASDRFFFLPVAHIDWLASAGNYVEVHSGDKTYLVRGTLTHFANRLDRRFVRISRTNIINTERALGFEPHFHGEYMALMPDGAKLLMSRKFRGNWGGLFEKA